MIIWRLSKKRHAATALSGQGNYLYGGRWNSSGSRAVYFAQSLSLAALETVVHLPRSGRDMEFVFFRVELPQLLKVATLTQEKLPKDWRSEPAPVSTQEVGTSWLGERTEAFLRVPSVIVPGEFNIMANPEHPDFRRMAVGQPVAFSFDPRMWKE